MNISRDLLLLVLSYASEEIDISLSRTNRNFLAAMKDLLPLESLWKIRYIADFHDKQCSYSHLLPETIDYYGWRKLYRLVKDFDLNKVGAFGTPYVGPTGNIYYSYDRRDEKYIKVHTCPILEVLFLEEVTSFEGKSVLLLVYISFDLSLRYYLMSDLLEVDGEFHVTSLLGNISGPCQYYFIDKDILIFLKQDGSVVYCDNRGKLKKLIGVLGHGAPYDYCGIEFIGVFDSTCIVKQRYTLHVNTFSVTYKVGGETKFIWPRTSPMYFEYLRKEMERLSVK
jgi:hypothetical protein